MCVPTRSKCEYKGLLETVKRFVIDAKQEENEDIMTHTKRFKQANNAFKHSVGDDWLDEFVVHTAECTATSDTNKQTKMKEEATEKFAAFMHMKNSETRKHGKLLSKSERTIRSRK